MTAHSIRDAQEAPTPAVPPQIVAIYEAMRESMCLGAALQFLAASEPMPSGLAALLDVLAERAHAVSRKLDGISTLGGGDE